MVEAEEGCHLTGQSIPTAQGEVAAEVLDACRLRMDARGHPQGFLHHANPEFSLERYLHRDCYVLALMCRLRSTQIPDNPLMQTSANTVISYRHHLLDVVHHTKAPEDRPNHI